jgi:hypothetical protein
MLKTFGSHVRGNVVGYIALFVALGGTTYAATGGNFILGQTNSASSTTSLTRTGANTGKGLQVTNASTGAGATALGLNVASGHAPFTVNSGAKVANLNADKLDGQDSTGFIRGKKMNLNLDASSGDSGLLRIVRIGPFDVLGDCQAHIGGGAALRIEVNNFGPAAGAETVVSAVRNDNTDLGNFSRAEQIPAEELLEVFRYEEGSGGYSRLGGDMVLRSESSGVVAQLDFIALVWDAADVCHIDGTAMMGS